MGKLEKLFGLDDEQDLSRRAPLWKRALWRGLKRLARQHPWAAISATASALGYATKQAAVEAGESAVDTLAPQSETRPIPGDDEGARNYRLDEEQKEELLGAIATEDLRRLAELADRTEAGSRK
jgi:hypothetical protein